MYERNEFRIIFKENAGLLSIGRHRDSVPLHLTNGKGFHAALRIDDTCHEETSPLKNENVLSPDGGGRRRKGERDAEYDQRE